MSVFIKGLTFPKDSPVAVIINPSGAAFVDYGGARFETLEAVDVPAPHGRLIDADALEDKLNGLFRARDYDTIDFYNHAIADCIATARNVPTIIEAEEGEGHE